MRTSTTTQAAKTRTVERLTGVSGSFGRGKDKTLVSVSLEFQDL